jgi:type I site-specific restriction-modification system R (restriction) subunit
MTDYKTIAESNNFIVLDKYSKYSEVNEGYQSEYDLERDFITDLENQGYEYLPDLNTPEKMLTNVRVQLQALNKVQFLDEEWLRFVEQYLDKPSDNSLDKTRKIHDDYIHDFVFDDGHIQNICLLKKEIKDIAQNKVQVIKQFEQKGTQANRYDVTVLVNGLPLVQIELKKRGWQSAKPLTKYTVIAKKALMPTIHCLNICSFLLSQTVPIVVILPIPLSAIKTVLISP